MIVDSDGVRIEIVNDKYESGHSFRIEPQHDEQLQTFLQRAVKEFARRDRLHASPERFVARYVNRVIPYDAAASERMYRATTVPPLGAFVDGAVCREKSMLAHVLLAQLGVVSEHVKAYIYYRLYETHAFLYVPATGHIVDPVWRSGIVMPKERYTERHGILGWTPHVFVRPASRDI